MLLKRFKSLTEGLPPTYWLLWTGTLVNRLGGFVVPFLTLYLTSQREIPVSQAGLMVSFFGAGSFIAQLSGGELTDRLGRRPVMLISFLVTPVAMITLGFAQSIPLIAVSTFVVGLFMDLYRPAVNAAIADLVPSESRIRAYGYNYWAINLGAAIAPVVAGILAKYTYLALFIGDAATTLVFGLIVYIGIRETRPVEAQDVGHASPRERLAQLKREPILLLFSFLALFFGIVYMQSFVTLPVDMQAAGLGPEQYGLAIAINGFLIVLVSIPVSNLAGHWPRFEAMAAAAVFLGLGFGYTALTNTFSLYALSIGIWTLGEIVASAVAPAIIADLSPVKLRGLYQGIFGSAWGLSFFLGPLLGGWVFEHLGAYVLWIGCLVIGVLLSIAFLGMRTAANRRMEKGTA